MERSSSSSSLNNKEAFLEDSVRHSSNSNNLNNSRVFSVEVVLYWVVANSRDNSNNRSSDSRRNPRDRVCGPRGAR